MPDTVAPNQVDMFSEWLKTEAPLWILFCVGLFFVFYYGPALIKAHIDFVNASKVAIQSLAGSQQEETRILNDFREENKESFNHISDAARPFSNAIIALAHSDNKEEVRRHLEEMQKILEKV